MIHKTGKIIVIEGSDCSGKETQTGILLERMRVHSSSFSLAFPRYDTSTGSFIRRCLNGDFGNFLELSPYLASLPYIEDFIAAQKELFARRTTSHALLDRYTPSNIAHQSVKLVSHRARQVFIEWVEDRMYNVHQILKPDVVLYLHVPITVSMQLMKERGTKKDQHEVDYDYQDRVIEAYKTLTEERSDWHLIECAPHGVLLDRKVINDAIWKIVEPMLVK
jgi:dTMP kinase